MSCSATPPSDVSNPLRLDPTWQSETVLALARGIATDNGFDRLPILADALEEAVCDNRAMLDHLRQDESHRVECWALRALLRTTLMLPGGVPITFAYCPPGSFMMGSDHPVAEEDEQPIHPVTMTKGIYSGIFPVTLAQWYAVRKSIPSYFMVSDRPVEQVTWDDAVFFCDIATGYTQYPIRLPTEAEWEYACRAGTTTEFNFGNTISDRLANYAATHSWNGSTGGVYRAETTKVGSFVGNQWGLFDCHGNVMEWCQDWHDSDYYATELMIDPTGPECHQTHRVCRGGSHRNPPINCRSATRGSTKPDRCESYIGFRVVFTA